MTTPTPIGGGAPWPDNVPAGRYHLDPAASSITVRAGHLFGLAPVTGTLRLLAGEIVLDPASRAASLTVRADPASIATGNRRRDKDLRSPRFLDAAVHPELDYRADTVGQRDGQWTVTGALTVRTLTRPVTWRVTAIESTGRGFRAHAHTRLDRYAFGVTAAKGMAVRHVEVEADVMAERL